MMKRLLRRFGAGLLLGSLAACITPVRPVVNSGSAQPSPDVLGGALFELPPDPDYRLPEGRVEVVVRDARVATRPKYTVRIPERTRTGASQTVAVQLSPTEVSRVVDWVEAHRTDGTRSLRLEVTVAEATAQWRALERLERERVLVEAQVRLLDTGSGEMLTSGKAKVHGYRNRYDASAPALLELLGDALVAAVHRGLSSREVMTSGVDLYPSATVVDAEAPAPINTDGCVSRSGLGASGGMGLWTPTAQRHGTGEFRGYAVYPLTRGWMLGVEGAFGARALANGAVMGAFEAGPRASYLWVPSETIRVEPSLSLLTGLGAAHQGAFAQATSSARRPVVDNGGGGGGGTGGGGGGYYYDPSTGNNGEPADGAWLVAARLGLGIGIQPDGPGDNPGVTLEPYVQLSGSPDRKLGPLVSFGLAVYLSSEQWVATSPRSFAALPPLPPRRSD